MSLLVDETSMVPLPLVKILVLLVINVDVDIDFDVDYNVDYNVDYDVDYDVVYDVDYNVDCDVDIDQLRQRNCSDKHNEAPPTSVETNSWRSVAFLLRLWPLDCK